MNKTIYVMAVRFYKPGSNNVSGYETAQYEVEADDLKTAMKAALDKAFEKMVFYTPQSIQIIPQRHYVKNVSKAVTDESEYNPAYFKLRSCTSKKAYAYQHQAQSDADSLNRKNKNNAYSVYPCIFCKFHHVGENSVPIKAG